MTESPAGGPPGDTDKQTAGNGPADDTASPAAPAPTAAATPTPAPTPTAATTPTPTRPAATPTLTAAPGGPEQAEIPILGRHVKGSSDLGMFIFALAFGGLGATAHCLYVFT